MDELLRQCGCRKMRFDLLDMSMSGVKKQAFVLQMFLSLLTSVQGLAAGNKEKMTT